MGGRGGVRDREGQSGKGLVVVLELTCLAASWRPADPDKLRKLTLGDSSPRLAETSSRRGTKKEGRKRQ